MTATRSLLFGCALACAAFGSRANAQRSLEDARQPRADRPATEAPEPEQPPAAQPTSSNGGRLPPPASFYDFTGRAVGPQPGPPRPLPVVQNPFGSTPPVLDEGRRLFLWYNCYGCHGGRAGGGMGPSLRDPVWLYGSSDAAIFNSIAEGRRFGMPAWGTKVPPEQLWQITAYIRSMGTPQEPDPPPANPVLTQPPETGEAQAREQHDGPP